MAIAELKAIGTLDGKQFQAEVGKLGNSVDKFGSKQLAGLKGMIVGAFSVGAIISFGRRLLKVADDMQTAANSFGLTMESMIALKTVMAESGVETDKFLRIFGYLSRAQSEVVEGSKTFTKTLEALNMTAEEFVGLPLDKLLETIAKRYVEAGGAAEVYGALSQIFGERIGPQLIEVFQRMDKEGLSAIEARTKSAAEGMKTLAAASDTLERTGNRITLWAANAVGGLETLMETLAGARKQYADLGVLEAEQVRRRRGAKPIEQEKTESANVIALREQEAIEAAKKEKEEREKIEKIVESAAEKVESQELKAWDKKIDAARDLKKLEEETTEEKTELLKKGIGQVEMGRVDVLQAIGGIVGGVAGADQAARRAERQEKILEEIRKIDQEFLKKQIELIAKVDEILVAD